MKAFDLYLALSGLLSDKEFEVLESNLEDKHYHKVVKKGNVTVEIKIDEE